MEANRQIKRGWNFYWYYLVVLVLIGFTLINYFSRNFKIEGLNAGLMISVVTFLFGFFVSLTLSSSLNKLGVLKRALSIETGRLVGLYSLSKRLGKEFHEKIREKIDKYTIATLRDYSTYEVGREISYEMYEDVENMEIKDEKHAAFAHSFLNILGEFLTNREELEYLTKKERKRIFRIINYLLGGILIMLLFLNRGDFFTNTIFVILSTAIVFIFLIIEDYDSLKTIDYSANISNSEQLFDLIGRERYYPSEVLNRVKLEEGKTYRIGFYDKRSKQEKIYTLQYNPRFDLKISSIVKGLSKVKGFDKFKGLGKLPKFGRK